MLKKHTNFITEKFFLKKHFVSELKDHTNMLAILALTHWEVTLQGFQENICSCFDDPISGKNAPVLNSFK